MKRLFFRLMIVVLWIVAPVWFMLPNLKEQLRELIFDFYPMSWEAFKKGSKV